MKVLKGKSLVAIQATILSSLVAYTYSRRGSVSISGSDQMNAGDEVLFGDKFEEIDLGLTVQNQRYYLMDEENVKIIYDGVPDPAEDNVLSFFKKEA